MLIKKSLKNKGKERKSCCVNGNQPLKKITSYFRNKLLPGVNDVCSEEVELGTDRTKLPPMQIKVVTSRTYALEKELGITWEIKSVK